VAVNGSPPLLFCRAFSCERDGQPQRIAARDGLWQRVGGVPNANGFRCSWNTSCGVPLPNWASSDGDAAAGGVGDRELGQSFDSSHRARLYHVSRGKIGHAVVGVAAKSGVFGNRGRRRSHRRHPLDVRSDSGRTLGRGHMGWVGLSDSSAADDSRRDGWDVNACRGPRPTSFDGTSTARVAELSGRHLSRNHLALELRRGTTRQVVDSALLSTMQHRPARRTAGL